MENENSDLESIEKSKLAHDILLGFHTQFAENQRTREQSFLKILGFLGAVIFGYAYVYNKLWTSIDKFSLVAIASELILMFGALIITTIAYNFRRDQFIIAKIRISCGTLGDDKIFPKAFDPSFSLKSKWRVFNWMPNFLGVFFLMFPIFQLFLYVSYSTKLKVHFAVANINGYVTATFLSFIISFLVTLLVTAYYFNQLRSKLGIKNNEVNVDKSNSRARQCDKENQV